MCFCLGPHIEYIFVYVYSLHVLILSVKDVVWFKRKKSEV